MDARADRNAADPERDRTVQAVRGAPTMAAAAAQLGITRSTLYRRLDRWGLHHVHDVS
jgi:transcriptional regulator of acetoin/glycerol metabolism